MNNETKDEILTRENEKIKKRHSVITIAIISIISIILLGIVVITLLFFWPMNVEEVKDSVVKVEVYDKNGDLITIGSGFCAFDEYTIVTNYHVIEGAYSINLVTDENSIIKVNKIIIFNKSKDIALLRISSSMNPLKIGDTSKLKVRQNVIAIGSPMGELNTVSEGKITSSDSKTEIRISAPISHGSSGGALLDEKGRVIGITSSGYDEAQNLNFAIPIGVAKGLYDSKLKSELTNDTYKNSMTNTEIKDYLLTRNLIIDDRNYYAKKVESLYYVTNEFAKYDETILNASGNMVEYYKKFSMINRKKSYEYFLELEKYDNSSNLSNSIANINSWNEYEWILNLEIMERWNLAITIINIEGKNEYEIGKFILNLPIGVAQKALLCAFYRVIPTDSWGKDVRKEVFSYINSLRLSANDKRIIYNKIYSDF